MRASSSTASNAPVDAPDGTAERLYDVVLRAAAQALDLVGHRAERRQKDDRRFAALRADRVEHGEAVGAGQHDVEQNQVVALRRDAPDGL